MMTVAQAKKLAADTYSEYPIAEIRRVVMGTHYQEGISLWLYTQDGKMLSVSSGCKNFERFHRYLQKKRPIEWE